jgi:macrolide-specific efflux system membrane fusion protein
VSVTRKWVFPILRLVVFTVIAVALVKLAFFSGAPDSAADPAVATGQLAEPQVAVAVGTIENDVTLTGTVSADPAVAVKATLAGAVRKVVATQGQAVDVGTPILTLRAQVPNADGTVSTKDATVVSPSAGVLSSLPALVGQSFAVGDAVAQVAPPGFTVSGTLPPEQLYRLINQPTEALVTIAGGPAPFTCTGLSIQSPLAGSSTTTGDAAAGDAQAGAPTSPTVRCAVPAGITVFPGLSAQVVIGGGRAENVLIVPITAVEGTAGTGNVYVVVDGDEPEVRPVTLGLNDGANVEVLTGLAEGDEILQFVPGAEAQPGCTIQPDGSEYCDGGTGG